MARKKWTPQAEVTDSLLKLREKRKWQLAYRRYVLEGAPSESYAPYFGLSAADLRTWFELQFGQGLGWENFGTHWQFDHIVPATYFDYSKEEDLKLCWSFINLRVEPIAQPETGGPSSPPHKNQIDVISARPYFQRLYDQTGLLLCQKMLDKIASLEISQIEATPAIESFICANKETLEQIADLTPAEFARYNTGTPIKDIFLEREILRKFS